MLETAQIIKNTTAIIEMSQHTYEHEVLVNFWQTRFSFLPK